jgi:hypothetical protein
MAHVICAGQAICHQPVHRAHFGSRAVSVPDGIGTYRKDGAERGRFGICAAQMIRK